jgi:actin-related protein
MMFEHYEVEKLYITNRTRLALYAAGLTTGLSIHSGDQLTQYVACNEGRLISPNSYLNTYVAGGDITDYLLKLLNSELNLNFVSSAEIQSVKHMKEKICHVVMDC